MPMPDVSDELNQNRTHHRRRRRMPWIVLASWRMRPSMHSLPMPDLMALDFGEDKSSSLAAFFTASFFYANGILQAQGSPTNVCVEQDCGRLQLKVQSIDSKLTLKDSNHLSLWLDSNRL
jgi:hypothetical protein